VCITSPGGSKSALQADWTPLNKRNVVVWPDNDDPGRQYAATVAKLCGEAGALPVSIVEPPGGVPAGWDAADALAEGFDEAQAARLFGAAARQQQKPKKPTADDAHGEGGGRQRGRPPQRDQLMGYVEGIELWHDDDGKAYATFPIGSHLENAAVRSSRFRDWLTLQYFDDHKAAPSRTAVDESLGTVEALARRCGRYTAFIRVAEQDGRIYHDLCNSDWQAVEINRHDWGVVDRLPVKFVRRDGMLPLPMPERVTERQSGIEELRSFFGNLSQPHFALVVAWLMSCFRDTGAYPILMIHALSASGKTFLTKLLTDLIDPTVDALQRIPDDELDLIARATQAHVVGFDNVSHISNRQSDALCRIATGESFSKIKKYTDEERVIYTAKRPILLNGIPRLSERGDLANRTFLVSLQPLADKLTGLELNRRWLDARPRTMAGLYDGVRAALNNFDRVNLPGESRLIGPLRWSTAAEPSFGFDDHEILRAYQDSDQETLQTSYEADVVAQAVTRFVRSLSLRQWEGTSTSLWDAINNFATEDAPTERARKSKSWPNSAAGLTGRIERAADVLQKVQGIYFERQKRVRNARLVTLFERVAD
jgi:hypothetical protein